MLQRIFLLAIISLQLLISTDEPNVCSVIFKKFDLQTSKIYPKLNSKALLQSITKFLPVRYQKGAAGSVVCSPYHIGDFTQGGVIIWLTQDGLHGLVAAIEDASYSQGNEWATGDAATKRIDAIDDDSLPLFYTPNTTPAENYSGYKNQQKIKNVDSNFSNYPAFAAAANYSYTMNGVEYNDWFLPSSSELSLMYAVRAIIKTVSEAHGGKGMLDDRSIDPPPPASTYWSSREHINDEAWYFNFSYGVQNFTKKSKTFAVRGVRAF